MRMEGFGDAEAVDQLAKAAFARLMGVAYLVLRDAILLSGKTEDG